MIRRSRRWFKARFRLDPDLVCEMSRGRGLADDFRDYPDSIHGEPWHFATPECRRRGKEFVI